MTNKPGYMRKWRRLKRKELGESYESKRNAVTVTPDNQRKRRVWDASDDVRLSLMENLSEIEVAQRLGRTVFAVRHRRIYLRAQNA